MKKRIFLIVLIFITLLFGFIFSKYRSKKSFDWNYDGKAVVLTTDSKHTFVEITDVTLSGIVYDSEKYFLGDLRVGTIEKEKHFHGEADFITKGMMTDYRYYRNKMGDAYFDTEKIQKQFELKIGQAQTYWNPVEIPDTKMLYFVWKEWFGETADSEYTTVGHLHFKKAGSELFVIETLNYLIVPGVSTRKEALSILHENFAYLDWYGFEQALELDFDSAQ